MYISNDLIDIKTPRDFNSVKVYTPLAKFSKTNLPFSSVIAFTGV